MSDEAIPAATLIVVREPRSAPPQLLMVERAQSMAFAGGAWVFPGGRIDEEDRRLAQILDVDPAAVAAVRETLEETAIPVAISPIPSPTTARSMQQRLANREPL